jgi:hypothetical protein
MNTKSDSGAEFEAMKGEFKPAEKHVFSIHEIEAQASELRKQHSDWSEARVNREAVDLLNQRRNAALKARDRDRLVSEKYVEAKAKGKAREDLPEVLDYEPSLKYITTGVVTGDSDWSKALAKFKRFAQHLFMRIALRKCKGDQTKAEVKAQEMADEFMDRIRNKPMVRDYVSPDLDDEKVQPPENYLELREMFVLFWDHHAAQQHRVAGKKGGRPKKVRK